MTKLTTPGGKPASAKSLPANNPPKGDFSDVLKMTYAGISYFLSGFWGEHHELCFLLLGLAQFSMRSSL